MAAHQCLKRLHFGIHRARDAQLSEKALLAITKGNEVGEIAKTIYGTPGWVEVEYQKNDVGAMLQQTQELLAQGADFPIFEATFQHEGVLVRVDVLIPDGDGWRAVEVKGSTKLKKHYKFDCAIQWWVMKGAGVSVKSISVALVNNQFVYAGDRDYKGMLVQRDVTKDADQLSDEVEKLVPKAREAAGAAVPDVLIGGHCNKPYDCEFWHLCWPFDAEYPTTGIGGYKSKQAEWINRGIKDLRDIPIEEITDETQQWIHRVTTAGEAELLPRAKEILKSLAYPRYYLDFETIGPAVPFWEGTRPYQALPVQWSIHIDDGKGDGSLASMRHEEFLDISGEPPMRRLAEELIRVLGDSGPVLMYTDYELRCINTLIELYPDLEASLKAIIKRLEDLAEILRDHYYHPSMLGSWSIKDVAPAISPHMDYANLEGINQGMAASDGFIEAIDPNTTADRKAELGEQLLRYCRFDTEAMVELARYMCPN
jgi:hypothetical protein